MTVGKYMQARADGPRVRGFVVRPLENGVLRAECRALRTSRGGSAHLAGGVQRAIERAEPAAFPRFVAECRDDQEVARARRRDIREANAFGLVPRHFFRLMLVEFVRRPPSNLDRT